MTHDSRKLSRTTAHTSLLQSISDFKASGSHQVSVHLSSMQDSTECLIASQNGKSMLVYGPARLCVSVPLCELLGVLR